MIAVRDEPVAPDFNAGDADGKVVRLSGYQGRQNVVLVFNRGFTSPYCRVHMTRLRQEYQRFVERDAEVIAVGPEDANAFGRWWHGEKMPFPGIPDPQHVIARMYGQQVKLLKFGRMPALVVIDKDGRLRFEHYGQSMSDFPPEEEIILVLDKLNREREAGGGSRVCS